MNRREFLRSSILCAAAISARRLVHPFRALDNTQLIAGSSAAFTPDVEIDLTAQPAKYEIFPGMQTSVWSYRGKVIKGRAGTLEDSGSYLGPTIRLQRGEKVRLHFHNELPESTIVHWHGLLVPPLMDGHPRLAIPNGAHYLYEFEVQNRAGHYWYHPHPHDRTGSQVYRGLAGQIFVHDDEESVLQLPSGDHEIPVVIQDRTFDGQELAYISGRMEAMMGFLGEQILVNGIPEREFKLGTGVYRLRFLNASNSRIYKLTWSNDMPFVIIGTDGGLLNRPLEKPYLTLAPAERADVILDLGRLTVGAAFELVSRPFPAAQMMTHGGMMGGRMGRRMGRMHRSTGVEQGAEFKVLRVQVVAKERTGFRMPVRLSQPGFHRLQEAENAGEPHEYLLSFMRMQWLLNETTFEMEEVEDNEVFEAGSMQTIVFKNTGMGMMQMAHPMHLHGGQFQVLKRTPGVGTDSMRTALGGGFTDEGWKDTVLILPGETVQLLMKFPRFRGLFLYHCHTLEHEDMGMMRNYRLI